MNSESNVQVVDPVSKRRSLLEFALEHMEIDSVGGHSAVNVITIGIDMGSGLSMSVSKIQLAQFVNPEPIWTNAPQPLWLREYMASSVEELFGHSSSDWLGF